MQDVSPDATSIATSDAPDDELVPVNEAARLLGVSRRTFYRLVEDGLIELVKVPSPGRRVNSRVRRSDIDQRLAAS